MNRIPQHGHDTWVPPSRRVPGRLPSGSCTVDAYGSEAGDAWGRGAGAAPARQTHGVAGPERLVPQNVCSPVRPHYAVSTMTAPYLPRAWFHHRAQQPPVLTPPRRPRAWAPSPCAAATTTLAHTLRGSISIHGNDDLGPCALCLVSTVHDDGNRVTHQTGPAARSRVPAPGSGHHFRGY